MRIREKERERERERGATEMEGHERRNSDVGLGWVGETTLAVQNANG